MAIPVKVAGRTNGLNPLDTLQAQNRAAQYVNPYVRAGWDNWKLALAEAELNIKQDQSAYDAKLDQYQALAKMRLSLEQDLSKLQLDAGKLGFDAAKTMYQEAQDNARLNANLLSDSMTTQFEEAGKNKRAALDAAISQRNTDVRAAVDEKTGGVAGRNTNATATQRFDQAFRTGDPVAATRAYLDTISTSTEVGVDKTPVTVGRDLAKRLGDKLGDPSVLASLPIAAIEAISAYKRSGEPVELPGQIDTGLSTGSLGAPTVKAPQGTLQAPDFTEQEKELRLRLAKLASQMEGLGLDEQEKVSLIDEARNVYQTKFKGFPGAKQDPLRDLKLRAAEKVKKLEEAYATRLDVDNESTWNSALAEYDDDVKAQVIPLVRSMNDKTDPKGVTTQLRKQYSDSPDKLEQAMSLYTFYKRADRF